MSNPPRPVGDAGRGKHTGKAGWLGGKHRKDGCLSMIAVPVAIILAAIAYLIA